MDDKDFNVELKPLPKAVPKDQGFDIAFLRNRQNNRRAFVASLSWSIIMMIIFSILISNFSANAYLIVGLILSVSGVFVSAIRISLGCLGLQPTVMVFVRSIFFFGEIFIGVSAVFLLIQNMSGAVAVILLFVVFVLFVLYETQRKFGGDFINTDSISVFNTNLPDDSSA